MQPFIAVSMVEMPVRVDQMLNWIIAKTHKCLLHSRARDSGVDKHFAIAAGEHSYVSTRTFKNANVTAKLVDGDLRASSGIADLNNRTFCNPCGSSHVTYFLRNASKSALMTEACVVIMPCG